MRGTWGLQLRLEVFLRRWGGNSLAFGWPSGHLHAPCSALLSPPPRAL